VKATLKGIGVFKDTSSMPPTLTPPPIIYLRIPFQMTRRMHNKISHCKLLEELCAVPGTTQYTDYLLASKRTGNPHFLPSMFSSLLDALVRLSMGVKTVARSQPDFSAKF
jgi:hypothetical protein